MVLMPIFAAQVLHGGPHTLGFLMGAVGVGALVSALSLALRRSVRGLTHDDSQSPQSSSAPASSPSASRTSSGSRCCMMLVTGFGMMQGLTASNTIIQTLVDENKRGRVMSYYTMAFVGMAPFGSLLAGALAHAIGAPRTVIVSGVAASWAALVHLAAPRHPQRHAPHLSAPRHHPSARVPLKKPPKADPLSLPREVS